ncbi:MAG TPA: hypothetical protein VFE46_05235 [Pirellulales bacterium]|jgi:hypothetical protein|nr:hypothetical protein [Pirellulales bacterium]
MRKHRELIGNIALWMIPLAAAVLPGCATEFDLSKGIPWEVGKEGKFETPMQVVAFWSDGVQTPAEKPKGVRGFGGRLYFYGKDPNKPVKVKGTLVVYAFDETNRDPKNVIPDKKYVFTPDQFQKKYSKSSLGDSYSIWLPWDEVGGMQKQVSLVVRFTGEKGEMITSDEAHQILPGEVPDKPTNTADKNAVTIANQVVALQPVPQIPLGAAAPVQSGVQQVSYQQPVGSSQPQTFSVMQTSTGASASQNAMSGIASQTAPIDVSVASPEPGMKTTTITVPTVPRPHSTAQGFSSPSASVPYGAGGYNAGVQPQMAVPNQVPVPYRIPVQNQGAVPMQSTMQFPGYNQGQRFAPPFQNGIMPNNAASITARGVPGAPSSAPTNGLPAASGLPMANADRFGFDRPRVLGAPIARLDPDRAQLLQSRGEPQSNLPSAPQSAPVQ